MDTVAAVIASVTVLLLFSFATWKFSGGVLTWWHRLRTHSALRAEATYLVQEGIEIIEARVDLAWREQIYMEKLATSPPAFVPEIHRALITGRLIEQRLRKRAIECGLQDYLSDGDSESSELGPASGTGAGSRTVVEWRDGKQIRRRA